VNLLANLDGELSLDPARLADLVRVVVKTKRALRRIKGDGVMDVGEQARLMRELMPDLLSVSKCPDFVVDRGHECGEYLADADKRALIEFLKTF
jgi:hypothetical protein